MKLRFSAKELESITAELSPERASCVIEIISSRYAAIHPLIQLSEVPGKIRFPHLFPDGVAANSWTESVAWCSTKSGLSKRTIWRLWGAFKVRSTKGLLPLPRKDKGTSRTFSRNILLCSFAAYLYLAHTKNMRAIHHAIYEIRELVDLSNGRSISYSSVRRWLLAMPHKTLVSFALEGQTKYRAIISDLANGLKAA